MMKIKITQSNQTLPKTKIFINKHIKKRVSVLDVGSMDINGTYKELGDVELNGRVVMEDNGSQIVMVV